MNSFDDLPMKRTRGDMVVPWSPIAYTGIAFMSSQFEVQVYLTYNFGIMGNLAGSPANYFILVVTYTIISWLVHTDQALLHIGLAQKRVRISFFHTCAHCSVPGGKADIIHCFRLGQIAG